MRTNDTCSALRGRYLRSASLGALALFAAERASAAETSSTQVEEVVVTAQHKAEKIQDVPISIQAFTSEALKDLGVKSTADLGQFTPNASIITPSGAGNQ